MYRRSFLMTRSFQIPSIFAFFLLSLICLLRPTSAISDLSSDRAALLLFRSALGGRLHQWDTSAASPCYWLGVVCARTPVGVVGVVRVVKLHLPGTSIAGRIPLGVFRTLSALEFISLRFNALSGPIPPDLFSPSSLQYVNLHGNDLSGEIPPAVFSASALVKLDLSHNRLSGRIPPDFNNLPNLSALLLDSNRLEGSIPNLNLPNLKNFNVSNNSLRGSIPYNLSSVFSPSSFLGNSLCGDPLPSCSLRGEGEERKNRLSGSAIAGLVLGALSAIFIALVIYFLYRWTKNKIEVFGRRCRAGSAVAPQATEMKIDAEMHAAGTGETPPPTPRGSTSAAPSSNNKKALVFFGNPPRVYNIDDLMEASAEVLGKGSYGSTYKAFLDGGDLVVAVKRLKDTTTATTGDHDQFRAKMDEVGRFSHQNLLGLRAYCCTGHERILIYDYMPAGSLSALLRGNRVGRRTHLNWETISNIVFGAARAVAYIHSQGPTASHGNFKSSNILLSESYEARVSEAGVARIMRPTNGPNCLRSYQAPEVTDPQKVTQKADVYSFGVFLLELLTGKAPLENEKAFDLQSWVLSVVKKCSVDVLDTELLRYWNREGEMVKLLQLAVNCADQNPNGRPSMVEVTARIERICEAAKERVEKQEVVERVVVLGL